jgi:hypothetical protein
VVRSAGYSTRISAPAATPSASWPGGPEPELIASAVAATFAGVLADWLHGLIEGTSAEIAHRVWRLLVTLHRTPLP